jgi:hypothetical protein
MPDRRLLALLFSKNRRGDVFGIFPPLSAGHIVILVHNRMTIGEEQAFPRETNPLRTACCTIEIVKLARRRRNRLQFGA